MAAQAQRRYCAFVSYSHKDRAAVDKLFRQLDGYRVPRALHGHDTRFGPVPKRLYPLFRDREELGTSGDLTARIDEALAASDHLIVLCSPHAAASTWVDKEVARFRQLGKGERIHAVIAEGEPDQAFPPALKPDGEAEPLAADLRKDGDGWTDGPLKVAAGLLGLPYGTLKDREVARARARARRNAVIAALFALLAVFAGVAAWRAVEETHRANAELTRAEAAILVAVEGIADIVGQVGVGAETGTIPTGVAEGLLRTADGMVGSVIGLAPDNPRLIDEQGQLLILFSRHYRTVGDVAAAEEAAAEAATLFADLATLQPGVDAADRMRSVALVERGDSLLAAGNREGALVAYEESLEIARRLAEADPGNTGWVHDLSVGLDRIGEMRDNAGDGDSALAAYQESLEIRRRLAEADPGNARWARDVSISLNNVGDMHRNAGDRDGALAAYEAGLQITRRLAETDPGNARWAHGVLASLGRIGNVRGDAGDWDDALAAYEESLEIARRLAATDSGNTDWARDLSVSLDRIGDIRGNAGDWEGALAAYQESLEIARRLAATDPGNAVWARDLFVSLTRIGDMRGDAGDRDGAIAAYEESLEIARRLAEADPSNADWMHNLFMTLANIGMFHETIDNRSAAENLYTQASQINERLLALDRRNADWTNDRAWLAERLAAVAADR